MKKTFFKTLALVLSILMALHAIPATALEELANTNNSFSETENEQSAVLESDNTSTETKEEHIYEDTSLREANTKHFKLDDGSYIAAQYSYPIHIKDESGAWQDIDNTLSDSGSDYTTSNARVKFAKKTTGNENLFTLHDGNYKITMSLNGANKKVDGVVSNNTDAESDTELQKMMNLEKLSSSIIYTDILDGVDLQYIVSSLNIKENIIVKEKQDSYSYSFTLKLNNLEAELTTEGSVRIIDSKTKALIYTVPAPIIYDTENIFASADDARYTLNDNGNGSYTLTVTVSSEWMNSSERAWPIVIDPAIYAIESSCVDTYISKIAPSTSWLSAYNLEVGRVSDTNEKIVYWKSTALPSIPDNSFIASAQLELYATLYNYQEAETFLGVYPVTSSWLNLFTWNQYATNSYGAIGDLYDNIRFSYQQVNSFVCADITDIYRNWVDGSLQNYGIAIKQIDDSKSGYCKFNSLESVGDNKPRLTVKYYIPKGLESYWTYASHNILNSGTGHVNLSSGELTLDFPMLSTTEAIFGYTPSLVYNSGLYNQYNINSNNSNIPYTVPSAGYGWRLNVNETISKSSRVKPDGENEDYYVLTDGDGTEHFFYLDSSTNKYKDEDGLLLTLTEDGSNYYITDSSHTVRSYLKIATGGMLNVVTDKFGNKLKMYLSEGGRCSGIGFCPAGYSSFTTHLTFSYNSNGCISSITSASTGHSVRFEYSTTATGTQSSSNGGYLRSIIFSKANTDYSNTQFTYSSAGILKNISDGITGNKIHYKFSSQKAILVREQGDDYGQTIGITYVGDTTRVRTSGSDDKYNNTDDILTHYVLDREGRAVSAYSSDLDVTTIYGASSGVYSEEADNKLKTQSISGGSTVNYLVNSNFGKENGVFAHWNASTNTTHLTQNDYVAKIHPQSSTSDYFSQVVKLPNGTYTFSADISTYNCLNVDLYLKAELLYPSSNIIDVPTVVMPLSEEHISSDLHPNLTFEVNGTDGYDYYIIKINANGNSNVPSDALITIKNATLERGIGAGENSIVDLGHFENTSLNTAGSVDLSLADAWNYVEGQSTDIMIAENEGITGNALKINGNATKAIGVMQHIDSFNSLPSLNNPNPEEIAVNRFYQFSGFVKGSHQTSGGFMGFRVIANCYTSSDGSTTADYVYEFPADNYITDYQFVSGSVIIPEEVYLRSISVYCAYDNNPGVAYFDDVSFVRVSDESVADYQYNSDGRVIKSTTPRATVYYEYNNVTGDLIKQNDSFGNVTLNTYNDNYSLYSTETYVEYDSEGITYPANIITTEYTYNNYGMLLQTKTTADQNTTPAFVSSSTYETSPTSHIFGKTLSYTDENRNTVRYSYDQATGLLIYQLNADGISGLYYTYDTVDRLQAVTPLVLGTMGDYYGSSDAENVSYTYNALNQLSGISTDTTDYTFTYDSFGNTVSVKAGNYTLATYTYAESNGKIAEMTYGNGTVVSYTYDALDRIEKISYNGSVRYEYQYRSDGKLHCVVDNASHTGYLYDYNKNGDLSGYTAYDTVDDVNILGVRYRYNDKGMIEEVASTLDYTYGSSNINTLQVLEQYFYDDAQELIGEYYTSVDMASKSVGITFGYDSIKRLRQKQYTLNSGETAQLTNTVTLTYYDVSGRYSSLVKSYSTRINNTAAWTFNYTYDSNGNITRITDNSGAVTRYEYDDMGQLIREDNPYTNKSYVFAYDNNGNRTSKKTYSYTTGTLGAATATQSYTYGDATWGDKLTAFNGTSITYDSIGNPLSYNNGTAYTFTWSGGRRLAAATKGGVSYSFTYNDEGIRTSKTVGGIKHNYVLDGTRIISEQWSNKLIIYLYDELGSPIGMLYRTNSYAVDTFDIFYFEKNLQGDIIAIYNASGLKVAGYAYDAWGNSTTTYYNGGSSTAAQYNPFRYRGYYYDADLGLYYLNSRYYDSRTGRFINADGQLNVPLLGYNQYAYCENNPVNMIDPSGNIPFFVITAAIGAVVGAVVGGVVAANNGGNVWAGIGIGAAAGALIGTGAGMVAGIALAGSITATTGAVIAGGEALASAVATGGLGAGTTYIANNIQQATNNMTSTGSTVADPVKNALKQLNASGLRPGQTEISRSRIMELVNNFDSVKAQSSINSIGGTRYLVDGHHTTVASTILGKGTCMNMGMVTNQLPSATNIYWTKQWYEFWKTAIKIMD